MRRGTVTHLSMASDNASPVACSITAPNTSVASEYPQALPGSNSKGTRAKRLRISCRSNGTRSSPSDTPAR